jgi:sodium/potassium-transporting ATPase subunit alpha
MIIICVATDVLPALSLVNEKPESDLLTQKPRNRKKDHLAGLRLLGHAYFFIGVLESLTAMAGFVHSRRVRMLLTNSLRAFYFGFQRNGVPFSALWLKYGGYDVDPAIIAELTNKAQSICTPTVLV